MPAQQLVRTPNASAARAAARPAARRTHLPFKPVAIAPRAARPAKRAVPVVALLASASTIRPLPQRPSIRTAARTSTGIPRRVRRVPVTAVQANLFSRLARVVTAFVSGFVSNFEDPERLLDRVVEEMQEDLVKMRQATAQVIASERQMGAKYKQAQATADEWLRRAELAVAKGQDDLAREALRRRKAFQENADKLKTQLEAQSRATEQLQANARTLESKLAEARNKKETLKARAAAAKSSREIQEMIGGLRLNNSSAWAAFDKMEEKVMELEASAESAALLSTPDSVEAQFAQLEVGTVDDELSALKKGMLRAPVAEASKGRIGDGRPLQDFFADSTVERELEVLRQRARS